MKKVPPNHKQQQPKKSNNFCTRNQQVQYVKTATVEYESSADAVYVFQIGNKPNTHPIPINDTVVNVILDYGSTINILDENSFNSIIIKLKLEKSSTKIYPYQSDSPLQLQGVTNATITKNKTLFSTNFYAVKGNYASLLGKQTAIALDLHRVGLPKVTAAINVPSDNIPPSTQEIIDKFDSFSTDRTSQKFELQLYIDPTIVLVQQPIRRLPYHTKEKISAELSCLSKLDIIEKVDNPTTWLNPIPYRNSVYILYTKIVQDI